MKKFGFVCMSIFLCFQSYKLIGLFDKLHNVNWGLAIFYAFLVNLFVTGVFAFLVFGTNIQRLLPDSYYHVMNPKRLKYVYEIFRVDLFRTFLLATVWKNEKDQKKFFDGTIGGLETLDINSRDSEFGHLVPFLILTGITIYLLVLAKYKIAFVTMLINIVFNFYPIPLQRHHRMRIQIMKKRIS